MFSNSKEIVCIIEISILTKITVIQIINLSIMEPGQTGRPAGLGFTAADTNHLLLVFQSLYEESVKPQQLVKDPSHGAPPPPPPPPLSTPHTITL